MIRYFMAVLLGWTLFITGNAYAFLHHRPTESPLPDIEKTCHEIGYEIAYNQQRIYNLIPTRNKHNFRAVMLTAGTIFSVPWIYLTYDDGDRYAIQNLVLRNEWLRTLAVKHQCRIKMPPQLDFPDGFDTPDVYMVSGKERMRTK